MAMLVLVQDIVEDLGVVVTDVQVVAEVLLPRERCWRRPQVLAGGMGSSSFRSKL